MDFEFRYGEAEQVSPLVRRIVAENPGPFTYAGTGTYIIGRGRVAVIDPGPLLPSHLDALLTNLAGETVTHILVTHTHIDHSPAAAPLKEATGAPLCGHGPHGHSGISGEAGVDANFHPDILLRDGDILQGENWQLVAHHTPGHTSNHLCYGLPQEAALFSGDHVMGWSTTVIVPPDGSMSAYMRSLRELQRLNYSVYWPTHGGPILNPSAHLSALIEHRLRRRGRILAAILQVPKTPAEIVRDVYTDVAPKLHNAAEQSTLAHLIELEEMGDVVRKGERWIAAP